MRSSRVVALVCGCLLLIPGIAMLLGGGALGLAHAFGRDDSGYFDSSLDRLASSTVAITAEPLTFGEIPDAPDWVTDELRIDVRLRATEANSAGDVFVGIARKADVDAYLAGVAHDEVISFTDGGTPEYRNRPGGNVVAAPTQQKFWVATASGAGTQELNWSASSGRWAAVVMNADGSPGVAADVDAGAKAGFVLPLALILLGVGAALTAGGVILIVVAVRRGRNQTIDRGGEPRASVPGATHAVVVENDHHRASPVALNAMLDPDLSSWKWLVKWFLAIPHVIVLAFLWVAFVVLTIVAGVAILFTGAYPRGIFDFNVGVLRWSWRVSYYAATGGVGTDRYPPFSLGPEPDYPATLEIAYPEHLSRGLALVKWWLLAIPHYIVVGLLIGGSPVWSTGAAGSVGSGASGSGLLGILVVVAGVVLLFTGTYPKALFALIVGFNRWIFRVAAYATLMTDRYPPFRLDQGGAEPEFPR